MTIQNFALNVSRRTSCPPDVAKPDWDDHSGVILTSYNLEDRLHRLGKVYQAIRWLVPGTAEKIGRLHDHKGLLTIFWLVRPTHKDRLTCAVVWGSSVAREQAENVEHLLYEAREI